MRGEAIEIPGGKSFHPHPSSFESHSARSSSPLGFQMQHDFTDQAVAGGVGAWIEAFRESLGDLLIIG